MRARDYPLMRGTFVILASVTIHANFAADLVYARLDPRVRFVRAETRRITAGPRRGGMSVMARPLWLRHERCLGRIDVVRVRAIGLALRLSSHRV